MVTFFQGLVITILEAICCKIFLDIFLPYKNFVTKYYKPCVIITLILFFEGLSSFPFHQAIFKPVFAISLILLVEVIYYKGKLSQKLFLAIIFYGLLAGIDVIALMIVTFFIPKTYQDTLQNPSATILLIFSCKMLLFFLILIISKKWKKEDDLSNISNLQWATLGCVPIMTIISLLTMVKVFKFEDQEIVNASIVIAMTLMSINFVIFYLIKDIIRKEKDGQLLKLMQERNKNQIKLYEQMQLEYQKQRKSIHEYKNQIECIQGLLVDSKQEEAMSYMKRITGAWNNDMNVIITHHTVVDAIINQKYRRAKQKNITMIVAANNLSQLQVDETDLVTILANILDNAIEATEKQKINRIIKLKVEFQENQLFISCKNPNCENLLIENNLIRTTKENKESHGLGLLNVKEVIEKNHGDCIIHCKDGWFIFSAMLQNPKTKKPEWV